MSKPVQISKQLKQNKVWQPSGYEGIEIGIKNSDSDLIFPRYFLQDYTIVLNGRGRGEVYYGSQHYTFTTVHDLVFLQNPEKVFSGRFWSERGASGACIVIPHSKFNKMMNSLDIEGTAYFADFLLSEKLNAFLATFVADCINTFIEPSSRLERETKLLLLIETILNYVSSVSVPENLGREHRAIALIKEILHTRPGEDHSLNSLSLLTNLNQKYLIDVFTKNVGLPPHSYLTDIRIRQAKRKLARGEAIAYIASDLGFYDQSHFSKTFKQYVRVSPGQFQRDSLKTT